MSPGQPMTLAICSQKVLPLDDLYEIYVMAMKPLGPEKFVRSNFALSGFSQKNMKKIVAAFADLKFEEDK